MCFALAQVSKCPNGKVLGFIEKALSRFKLIANVCQVIRQNLPSSSGVAGPVGCSSNTVESGFESDMAWLCSWLWLHLLKPQP